MHFSQITFSLLFAMMVLNEATKIIGIKWTWNKKLSIPVIAEPYP